MSLVSMTEMLRKAKAEKYAVGQFNINNLEFTQAIVEAAIEEGSPVILGVSEGAIKYMGLEYTVALAKTAAEISDIPIALHLDHGSSFEIAMKVIRAGFSSVMFDGSHYSYEQNVILTKKIVEAARAMGVSVEGELGTIGGTEDDLSVEDKDALLANPLEAIKYYKDTDVDALAIAVGSAHGVYKGEPKIRFDIIEAVCKEIDIPLVLHGGSGIPDETIKKAIKAGIGKINVNTECQIVMTKKIREIFINDSKVYDPRKYLGPGREEIKRAVKEKIILFGSNGKA
ncbi:MAG: class II fructose-1,6-bisphosphate aldolase [Vulcanibacillus sp.]